MPTSAQRLHDAAAHAWDGALSARDRLDLIRDLEELKATAAAAQVRLAVAFEREVVATREAQGVPERRWRDGIVAEIALARRESPHRTAQLMTASRLLVDEMPATLAGLESGELSEFRAMLITRETACLSPDARAELDVELCGDLDRISGWGTRRLGDEARRIAYRLDPEAATERAAQARQDRHTGLRPAPDTMTWFGALLPVEHGVAVHATLRRLAERAVAGGDGRSRGQLMADGLVEKVTGLDLRVLSAQQDPASWSSTRPEVAREAEEAHHGVPIAVGLVVSDETLLADGSEPGWLEDHGPIPAPLARQLVLTGLDRSTVRRLYAAPDGGSLVAMDSRARLFPSGLARLIAARDRTCRTPWCDAPIRHLDHAVDHGRGGTTDYDNGQGLCARCNLAKQAPGWRSEPAATDTGTHEVVVTSPHGRPERSRAPDPPPPLRRLWPSSSAARVDFHWVERVA